MKKQSNKAKKDQGAAMVELALILPLLLMLVVGIIQFGIVYNKQITLQQASREGARALALRVPQATAEATAIAAATGVTATATSSVCPTTSSSAVDLATMTLRTTYRISIPFVFTRDLNLSGTAKMRCGL